jgi:hypothetical protein
MLFLLVSVLFVFGISSSFEIVKEDHHIQVSRRELIDEINVK